MKRDQRVQPRKLVQLRINRTFPPQTIINNNIIIEDENPHCKGQ